MKCIFRMPAIRQFYLHFLKTTPQQLPCLISTSKPFSYPFSHADFQCTRAHNITSAASFLPWCGKGAKSSGRLPHYFTMCISPRKTKIKEDDSEGADMFFLFSLFPCSTHTRVMSRIYRYLNAFSAAQEYNNSRDEGPLCPSVLSIISLCVIIYIHRPLLRSCTLYLIGPFYLYVMTSRTDLMIHDMSLD